MATFDPNKHPRGAGGEFTATSTSENDGGDALSRDRDEADRAREQARMIRSQVHNGVLMSLGARQMWADRNAEGNPAFGFKATIKTKAGGANRVMDVEVELDPSDTYNIKVTHPQRGDRYGLHEPVAHFEADGVYVDRLNSTLLSLDDVD